MLVTFFKFVVLAALAPIWWPILKALYHEVNAALLEEGGLLGRPPSKDELGELREKYKDYQDPLISQPWAEARPAPRSSPRSAPGEPGPGARPSSGPTLRTRGSGGLQRQSRRAF